MSNIPSWELAPVGSFGELRFVSPTQAVQRFIQLPVPASLMKAALDECGRRSQDGWDVYFGLNPRVRRRGRNGDVEVCTAFWIDLDEGVERAAQTFDRLRLPPSAVVSSGHGFHVYWLLQTCVLAKDAIRVAQALCRAIDCDPVWSPAATPRLPGTMNWKNRRQPTPTLLLAASNIRYTLFDLSDRLREYVTGPVPPTPVQKALPKRFQPLSQSVVLGLNMPMKLKQVLLNYANLDRSRADAAFAVWAVEQSWTDDEIVSLLSSPLGSKAVERLHQSGVEAAQQYVTGTIAWAKRTVMRNTGGRP